MTLFRDPFPRSTCRENRTFQVLPLDDALAKRNVQPRYGLQVVDLRTGDVVHSLSIEGIVRELYDVALLPGVVRPAALGFKTDEIRAQSRSRSNTVSR